MNSSALDASKPMLSIIVAQSANRVIGCDNQLPWHLPEDLQYFKQVTMGKPVVMGRKTFDSIGRLLPGRVNVVVTRQVGWSFPGARVAASLAEAVELASQGDVTEIMIIGGAQIYLEALPLVDRIYLTEVHKDYDGDAWFPELPVDQWQQVDRKTCRDVDSGIDFSFVTLERSIV